MKNWAVQGSKEFGDWLYKTFNNGANITGKHEGYCYWNDGLSAKGWEYDDITFRKIISFEDFIKYVVNKEPINQEPNYEIY